MLPQIAPGFKADDVPLPAAPVGMSDDVRRQAALVVLRIGRGETPEAVVSRPSSAALQLFAEDELEREEALAHVDILANILAT